MNLKIITGYKDYLGTAVEDQIVHQMKIDLQITIKRT
jgi:hypothetical protein